MKKTGLVLGKFAPLHKGHQYIIETALREMDELYVMIYDTDLIEVPLHVRSRWIRTLYPKAKVIEAWDGPQEVGDTPEIKKLNEDYILQRMKDINITHFYSNEFYGDHVSKALGAQNRQIDLNRDTFPISATMIRENAFKHRAFINPLVYNDLIIKVVFVGAMSTGKTTICSQLADKYNTVWMPEYGREYWEKHQVNRRITAEQMVEIAKGHIEREDKLFYESNKYFFVDTNAITTYMFGMDYQGYVLDELQMMALKAQSRYDLYFLCCDDIPYDDTWDRSGDQKRQVFQKQIIADLKERKIPYVELRGSLEERMSVVDRVLNRFRKYDNPAYLGV
ncbi:AAA family ATPase [Pseudobacteroides cellulosolvens]|uniref:Cytidyltransferase-related domain protein n=1 Tax=Pseudobacteroides cellulosolvens ATCC 35603 = DSM 2933 TaxID=398512 RepID=A0A0L6JHG8_9FIRM|nr:AAA family ATPase [Pseudobacteroides cellulosolvens]KNY25169.1 cytidyltransferase-related domain protein [Pseudobacteroides cellulosolvens ATCC 35603 = DSM 2933]